VRAAKHKGAERGELSDHMDAKVSRELLQKVSEIMAWRGHVLEQIVAGNPCPNGGGCGRCPSCFARRGLDDPPEMMHWAEMELIRAHRARQPYEAQVRDALVAAVSKLIEDRGFMSGLAAIRLRRLPPHD
jgi:hypothetical protein